MKLAIIAAVAKNGVIGNKNQLPWHLPEDLKYFKAVTFGKPVIMGRKTYESIGRPLPGRTNIVITRDKTWRAAESVITTDSVDAAIEQAKIVLAKSLNNSEEIMVIGGAEIYRALLDCADKIYLTRVDIEPEGDAQFPYLDPNLWKLESIEQGNKFASIKHDFLIYNRSHNE